MREEGEITLGMREEVEIALCLREVGDRVPVSQEGETPRGGAYKREYTVLGSAQEGEGTRGGAREREEAGMDIMRGGGMVRFLEGTRGGLHDEEGAMNVALS